MHYLTSLYSNPTALASTFATPGLLASMNPQTKPEDSNLALQLLAASAARTSASSLDINNGKTNSTESVTSTLSKLTSMIPGSFDSTASKKDSLSNKQVGPLNVNSNTNAMTAMLRALSNPGSADLSSLGLGGMGLNSSSSQTSMNAATQAAAAAMLQLTYASSLQNQLNLNSHVTNLQSKVCKSSKHNFFADFPLFNVLNLKLKKCDTGKCWTKILERELFNL